MGAAEWASLAAAIVGSKRTAQAVVQRARLMLGRNKSYSTRTLSVGRRHAHNRLGLHPPRKRKRGDETLPTPVAPKRVTDPAPQVLSIPK
jgi:hypothetical protein